jgi:hypothetical protein
MKLNIFQLHKSEQWLGNLYFSQLHNAMTLSSYITCVYNFLAIFLSITEWMGKQFLKYCYWQESEPGAFVFNKHVLVYRHKLPVLSEISQWNCIIVSVLCIYRDCITPFWVFFAGACQCKILKKKYRRKKVIQKMYFWKIKKNTERWDIKLKC